MSIVRWPLLTIVVAALCALAAGCGGEGDDPTTAAEVGPPPKGSPAEVAQRLLRVVGAARTNADCKPIRPIIVRSSTKLFCPTPPQFPRIERFRLVGSEIYETAAVIDYTTKKRPEGASMTMFKAPDGKWGISRLGLLYEPSAGTSDEDNRDGYEDAVTAYLDAVRERDCDAYINHALTNPDAKIPTCRGEFRDTIWLAKALRANPDAPPDYLGGNEVFGFYGLEVERPKPGYVTFDVVKTAEGAAVPFIVMAANRSAAP